MGPRHVARPLILIVPLIALFLLLAALVGSGASHELDVALVEAVGGPALSGPLGLFRIITELGSTWAITVVAVGAGALGLFLRRPRVGLAAALTIGAASLANGWIKALVARERPEILEPILVEHGFSFPSGHAALSMVAYGIVAVLVRHGTLGIAARRAIVAGLAAVVLLVGLSRVWLGVHYPTDVIAGWSAGAIVVVSFSALSRPALRRDAAEAAADRAAPRSDRPAPESAPRRG